MVKLSTFVLVALGSLTAAQNYDQWRKLCNSNENKEYCQQLIEWVRGGQQGRQPQASASATRPKPSSPKSIITPLPKSSQSPWQPQEVPAQPPPWQAQPSKPSKPSQPAQTWPAQTWPAPEPIQETSRNLPPPTPAPQQGSVPSPFEQAVCTVEIYSYTTRPEGQRTRTRTRTIIAPFVSTVTQLITTDTTSIQVETIVQEQKEQTVTSSQTVCN